MLTFTKSDEPRRRAQNISKTGAVYYFIWHDQFGEEYVQIVENVGGPGDGQGSFSKNLYKTVDIGSGMPIIGYHPNTGEAKPAKDRNMKAFLDAVKADLLERRAIVNAQYRDNH